MKSWQAWIPVSAKSAEMCNSINGVWMLDPKSKEKKNPKLLSKNMLICQQASAFNKI